MIQGPYILIYITSVFLASISQVLLKKAALRHHDSVWEEYTDWRVLLGYCLFFGCTFLTMLAYRGIPLSLGPALETSGYFFITIFGITIFHERLTRKKMVALVLIISGILLYSI